MHILTAVMFIGFAWRWGNWQNWKEYYPTLLYVSMCNLLYNFFCHDFLLWKWIPDFMPNHLITDIFYIYVTVPATAYLFLSRFPEGSLFKRKFIYFVMWVIAYVLMEVVWIGFDKIRYYHGWNLGWSALFYIIMFSFIRIHLKKPLFALLLTALAVVFFIWVFDIPLQNEQ